MKILITGGSGFIGTNLIEGLYGQEGTMLLNIDNTQPKIDEHRKVWQNVDIRSREKLKELVKTFSPDYVIHLAARTDLNGKTLEDYNANMQGVTNLLDALEQVLMLRIPFMVKAKLKRRKE